MPGGFFTVPLVHPEIYFPDARQVSKEFIVKDERVRTGDGSFILDGHQGDLDPDAGLFSPVLSISLRPFYNRRITA